MRGVSHGGLSGGLREHDSIVMRGPAADGVAKLRSHDRPRREAPIPGFAAKAGRQGQPGMRRARMAARRRRMRRQLLGTVMAPQFCDAIRGGRGRGLRA
jgi:hypothetical protein